MFFFLLGNAAYLAIAMDSDLGIIDPYRASDNFVRKLTFSRNSNKIETFDIMWRKDALYVFWANKQESSIFSATIPLSDQKLEGGLKNLVNDSGTPLVSNVIEFFEIKVQSKEQRKKMRFYKICSA